MILKNNKMSFGLIDAILPNDVSGTVRIFIIIIVLLHIVALIYLFTLLSGRNAKSPDQAIKKKLPQMLRDELAPISRPDKKKSS